MKEVISDLLRRSMAKIAERSGSPEYPFVDTKFDIVTGRDFDDSDEPFRRKSCIYSWIQGRGIESFAKHALFFEGHGDTELASKLKSALAVVTEKMESLRQQNGGILPFAMKGDGSSFFPPETAPATFSDLFYSKGLIAAGRVLNTAGYEEEGRKLFRNVLESIRFQTFRSGQQSFDPQNQVAYVEGKFPQGPRMIALGGLADCIGYYPDESEWADTAEEFICFIFDHHVHFDAMPELRKYDFIESIGTDGKAWRDGKMIFCDPGHALEFTGLCAKCLLRLKSRPKLLAEAAFLPELFCHVFDYGFNFQSGGICKGYDLVARKPVNSDMPWWSLPETFRAGMELAELFPEYREETACRAGMALQAFLQGFLQPCGLGCQTRDQAGNIVAVVPAVPDADPGYHTNLSLIDILK